MDISNHQHEFGKIIQEDVSCGKRPRLIRRCKICGYVEVVGLSGQISQHNFSNQEIIKASTCTEQGKANIICSKCGERKSVSLPPNGHRYQNNNLFYKTCAVCQKNELTAFSKRSLIIAGSGAFLSSMAYIGLSALSPHFSSISEENSVTAVKSDFTSQTTETVPIQTSENNSDIQINRTNVYSSDYDEDSLYLQSFPDNILADESIISKTSISTDSEIFVEDTSEASQTEAMSEDTSGASQTEAMPEESSAAEQAETSSSEVTHETSATSATPATTFEPSATTVATPATTVATTSATSATTVATPATTVATTSATPATTSETSATTAATTAAVSETSQDDYSYLIGRLVYGSEIIDLVNLGAPLEIITSQGEKYFANTGSTSNFDSSAISSDSLYTVNIGTIDDLSIIIFNEL